MALGFRLSEEFDAGVVCTVLKTWKGWQWVCEVHTHTMWSIFIELQKSSVCSFYMFVHLHGTTQLLLNRFSWNCVWGGWGWSVLTCVRIRVWLKLYGNSWHDVMSCSLSGLSW